MVSEWIHRYEKVVLALVIAAVLAFVARRLWQRLHVEAAASEMPVDRHAQD
jgi:hypothetical protein